MNAEIRVVRQLILISPIESQIKMFEPLLLRPREPNIHTHKPTQFLNSNNIDFFRPFFAKFCRTVQTSVQNLTP